MSRLVPVTVGDVFNSWQVLEVCQTIPITLVCRCSCGDTRTLIKTNVVGGKSRKCKSCAIKERTVHGARNTRLHNIWQGMVQRCTSDQSKATKNYKQLGITLCADWYSFLTFKDWAYANGYSDTLSLDRANTYKGYNPENCRWASRSVQSSNRRKMPTNTSGFVGVSEIKTAPKLKWKAYICIAGKHVNLGRFETPEEASKHRDAYIAANNLTDYPTEAQRNVI